jgi:uncharacterized protein involved in exopolysaccharide biosynthesis
VTLVAALAALGYSLAQPRTYRAQAQVVVLSARDNWDLKLYLEPRMGLLRAALLSFPQTDPALPAGLQGRLHVGLVPEEARIVIEVDDPDPQQAAQLANDLAGRLQDWVDDEFDPTQAGEDAITVRVLVPATVPGAPYGPRYQLNTVAGAVLGALVGLPAAFVWDALGRKRDRVTDTR